MRPVQARCPNCDAILPFQAGAEWTTCSYCGTTSRLQRRTRVFQVPVRMPAPAPGAPTHVARQVKSATGALVVVMFVVALGAAIAGVAVFAVRHIGQSMGWNGLGPPLMTFVDDDHVEDVVGLVRYVNDRDSMYLAAFSGKDGHRLWQSERLGSYREVYQGRTVLANHCVVFADPRGNVHAFDPRTGKARWTRSVGEKVRAICGMRDDISVDTADGRRTRITLADGAVHDAEPGDWCARLPSDAPNSVAWIMDSRGRDSRAHVDGMKIDRVLLDGDRGAAIGHKSPGTRVPMVAGIDGTEKVLWSEQVPSSDPLRAKPGSPDLATVDGDLIVVVYKRQDGPPMIAAFDQASGARRWETPIRKGVTIVMTGVTATKDVVLVSSWGHLQAFDRASGRPLWMVGRP